MCSDVAVGVVPGLQGRTVVMDRRAVCCRYVWCLDFKGGLFCSVLPETGLNWQRFEDNVHQVALSPSGELLNPSSLFIKSCHVYFQPAVAM